MRVIAQVLGHLRVQRGLEHIRRQLIEQPVRPDRFGSFLRQRQQLLGELPLIQFRRHGIARFLHCQSFPPTQLGVSDQGRSTVVHTIPELLAEAGSRR
jgi:hypothetical protein